QAAGMALFTAGQAPDKGAVGRVVLFNTGLLLDHLRAVQAQTRLTGKDQIATQPGGDAHAAEAANRAGNYADHRLVFTQLDDGCLDLGDGGQAQIGFLQTHAAGFQQQYGTGGNAVAVVFSGQLQRAGDLGAADLAHTAALERALDGGDHRRLAVDGALGHHHAVVGLGGDALLGQPGRGDTIEGIEQFAEAAVVQQGTGTLAGGEYDEAA